MSILKKYNVATSQWEPIVTGVVGPTGPTGVAGPTGATGVGATGATGSTGPTGATGTVSLASPAFTGTPTAPTATAATNNTQIATTAYADAAVAALVDSAPATLNTLDELALALGDDANFATTTATAIGLKAPLASPTFTGTPTLPSGTIATTQTASNNTTAVATTAYVDAADALKATIGSTNTFTTNQIISGTTTTDLLRITQLGTGNALIVEDSTNPDSTPFVVDGSGRVGIGMTAPGVSLQVQNTTQAAAYFDTASNNSAVDLRRNNGTFATPLTVASGNIVGTLDFSGHDGTSYNQLARVTGSVDGTVSTGIVPGRLLFSTENTSGTLTERMRIDSAGFVGIGVTAPTVRLDVSGSTTISSQNNVAAAFGSGTSGRLLVGSITANTPFIGSEGATNLLFYTNAVERMRIDSSGQVGIGGTPSAGRSLSVTKNLTGSTSSFSIVTNPVIQSDVTTEAAMFRSSASTAAAAFTITNFYNYQAFGAGIGAGSAITTQFGYFVGSGLTTATNNYGFYGDIASGANRWNLYMNGTAANYMAGRLGIGATLTSGAMALITNTTAADKALVVKGASSQTGNLQDWQDSAGTVLAHVTSAGAAKFVSIDGGTA